MVRLTTFLKAKIVVLWEENKSIKQIARELNITRNTIRRWVSVTNEGGTWSVINQALVPVLTLTNLRDTGKLLKDTSRCSPVRMSVTYTLSESSSACSCACAGPGAPDFFPLWLPDSNAFPFSTQPIVYRTKVPTPQPEHYSKDYDKKNKPNHFVKAFNWYTREQGGTKNTQSGSPEIGFATWLDHKYNEYVRDGSKDVNFKYEASNDQDPTDDEDAVARKQDQPKGLKRVMRSPWRKRYCNIAARSPEKRSCCPACKSSWQTLLKPKSLCRFESENCARKRSASSKVTVTSSDTQITNNSKRRDIIVQEITKSNDYSNLDNNNSVKSSTRTIDGLQSKDTVPYTLTKKNSKKLKYKVKCECPQEEVKIATMTDADAQYEANQVTPMASKDAYAAVANENNSALKNTHASDKEDNLCECPMETYTCDGMKHDGNKDTEENITDENVTNASAERSNDTVPYKLAEKNSKKNKYKVKCECPPEEVNIATMTDADTQYEANVNVEEKPIKSDASTHVSKSDYINKSTELITPMATKDAYAAAGTSNENNSALKNTHASDRDDNLCECPMETYTCDGMKHDGNNVTEESKPLNNITEVPVKQDVKATADMRSAKHHDHEKPFPMPFTNECVQTSDFAILTGHVTRDLPLLLRIIHINKVVK